MGLFTQILRDSLAKSLHPHQKGNPLTTIGLSPLILGLGLSDNELFKFCLDMAKDLVVHFHPDRYEAAATTVELQRKFAGAFEDLKRRELFDKALAEFRQIHSEEKSELNEIQRVASTQRELLNETSAKLVEAETFSRSNSVRYEEVRTRLHSFIVLRGATFSKSATDKLGACTIRETKRLNLLTFEYVPCHLPDPAVVSRYQEQYRRLTKEKGWDEQEIVRFGGELSGHRLGGAPVSELVKQALQRRSKSIDVVMEKIGKKYGPELEHGLEQADLFPTVDWTQLMGYRKLGFSRFATGMAGGREALNDEPLTKLSLFGLSSRYASALQSIQTLMSERAKGVQHLRVWLESVEVAEGGVIRVGRQHYPIIGSIQVEHINPRTFYLKESDPEIPKELLLDKLQPVLMKGSVLVCLSASEVSTVRGGREATGHRIDIAAEKLSGVRVRSVILECLSDDD